jgi:citrate synthase
MGNMHWTTKISTTSENGIVIRGYDLLELIGTVPFPSVVYLLFTGELPTPEVAKLIDALMVACIDHGPGTPSALAARTAASGGASLGPAAAAGLLSLGKFHGAAIEDSMRTIMKVVEVQNRDALPVDSAADLVVAEMRQAKQRVSGFGHRQHKKKDPRLNRLFSLAQEAQVSGSYLEAAHAISRALANSTGRDLPVNIDGATAAILCEVGFPPTLSNALFMVARLTGILVHVNEEISEMTPMRRIDPVDISYDGHSPRPLSPAKPAQSS